MESEVGAGTAKKDSKRKRESSVSDDVEVKSPPPSPPEDDDDDGVQVKVTMKKMGQCPRLQRGTDLADVCCLCCKPAMLKDQVHQSLCQAHMMHQQLPLSCCIHFAFQI